MEAVNKEDRRRPLRPVVVSNSEFWILDIKKEQRSNLCSYCRALDIADNEQHINPKILGEDKTCQAHADWLVNVMKHHIRMEDAERKFDFRQKLKQQK